MFNGDTHLKMIIQLSNYHLNLQEAYKAVGPNSEIIDKNLKFQMKNRKICITNKENNKLQTENKKKVKNCS